jgi:hypothetical protein
MLFFGTTWKHKTAPGTGSGEVMLFKPPTRKNSMVVYGGAPTFVDAFQNVLFYF